MSKKPVFKTEELEEAFTMNCSADKTIPLARLGQVARSVGCAPTEYQLRVIKDELEKKGKSTLTYQEVHTILLKYEFPPETAENLREAFRIFDKDGCGRVNSAELRHVLTSLGEKLNEEEVDEMLREADMTGEGQINYIEFVKTMDGGR